MKSDIIYFTISGHSKKMAKKIGSVLNIEPKDIKSNPILKDIDYLYIITGIYGAKSSPDMIKYIKTLTLENVKKVILITSSGEKTTKALEIREILENNSVKVIDEFVYPGGFLCFGGHPNKSDLENVLNFIKNLKLN